MRPLLRSSLFVALLAGCGTEPAAPVWIDLAQGFEPRPLAESARTWPLVRADGGEIRVADEGDEVWIETTLETARWRAEGPPGAWSAERPWEGAFANTGDGATRLSMGGRAHEESDGSRIEPGLYYLDEERIFLATEPDAAPEDVVFGVRASNGRAENGIWRVGTLDHVGSGIPVWEGAPEELVVDVPAGGVLRFATVFERLPDGIADDGGDSTARATFRVRADGAVLWEESGLGAAEHRALPLEPGRTTLSFELEGGPGRGVFQVPRIAPAEVGRYGARPWEEERRDLVLFIADTFRADNMAIYGGKPELTPELNRFAEESLTYLSARSTAAWTLPSISSILTGLEPPQHGGTEEHLSISRSLTTIAETLSRQGYRTVAVTDSGFFAPAFGLDQGFELFHENRIHHWHLTKTIDQALAALDADDGRPLFLVVHTYRVHGPFRTGPEEDQSAFDAFLEKGAALRDAQEGLLAARKDALLPFLDEWVGLYEAGVEDMDFKFGRFRRELEARDVLRSGVLLFCGDHGQAHGENQDVAHGGKLWESKLRVPLVLHGAGIEPGRVRIPVTHVDLAPTLGALAGVPREPDWVGTSLFELEDDGRPTFSFRMEGPGKEEVAIHRRDRKVWGRPDPDALRRGEVLEAYDLGADPGELVNKKDEAEWAAEMAREMADAVEAFLRRKAAEGEADVDPELERRLRAIGYGGTRED